MGCGYECATSSFFAINIPSRVDFYAVCDYLVTNEVLWEHGDPTCEEVHPGGG